MSKGKTGFRKDVFRKTMKAGPEVERRSRGTEFYSLPIEVVPSDKNRLEGFFTQELTYFNHLIENFSSRVRSIPESLLEFDETWIKVLGAVAAEGKSVKPLMKSLEYVKFPAALEPYKTQLLGVDSNGARHLTERKMLVLDLAAGPGVLLPTVRKNMAIEAFKHYAEQATRVLNPGAKRPGHEDDEMAYKIAPEMLEVVDSDRKRHLQIPKSCVKLKWDPEKEETLIGVEYAVKPIVVKGVNLIQDHDWNFMIIHQEPGQMVNPATPWVVDLRKTSSGYLLKYLDCSRSFRSKHYDVNVRRK